MQFGEHFGQERDGDVQTKVARPNWVCMATTKIGYPVGYKQGGKDCATMACNMAHMAGL